MTNRNVDVDVDAIKLLHCRWFEKMPYIEETSLYKRN